MTVNTIDDFVVLLRDGLGIDVSPADVGRTLDEVPGWDSLHLLWLLGAMERATGRSVALPQVLEAPTLEHVYGLYVDR